MNEEYSQWLNGLKVGDKVIVNGRNGYYVEQVAKITPTQIQTSKEKFRKETGRRIGDDAWIIAHLEKPTPEILATIKKRIVVAKLRHKVKWEDCDLETLTKVFELVKLHVE
jgi:predicted ATP-grasp superfamily ATP-dependent carboligase